VLPAALPRPERIVGVYTAFLTGTRLNFVENPETVPENVREIAPTVFGAVPRIWEKFIRWC
jgi:long-chain acyl-CoA synthetase